MKQTKIIGSLALILPHPPKRVKEWAYAGLTFDFVFATVEPGRSTVSVVLFSFRSQY